MSNAKLGHAAFDATTGLAETLAGLDDNDTRVAFLRAAVAHADTQLAIAVEQWEKITEKAAEVADQWNGKVTESHNIMDAAAKTLDGYSRELEALEN